MYSFKSLTGHDGVTFKAKWCVPGTNLFVGNPLVHELDKLCLTHCKPLARFKTWTLDLYSELSWCLCYAVGAFCLYGFDPLVFLEGKVIAHQYIFWMITDIIWWNASLLMSEMPMLPSINHTGSLSGKVSTKMMWSTFCSHQISV